MDFLLPPLITTDFLLPRKKALPLRRDGVGEGKKKTLPLARTGLMKGGVVPPGIVIYFQVVEYHYFLKATQL